MHLADLRSLRHRPFAILLSLALAASVGPAHADTPAPAVARGQARAQVLTAAQIDTLVERTMKAFNVPGIAVAVVKDGKVLTSKGYGVRSLKTQEKMTADTLAGIASNSKAFTTAALGILVDEKKLTWDDKVTDTIPEFKLYNPYVTEEFTIRDLLTHRSGLGLGAGDLMFFPYGSDFTVKDVIHNLRYLKQTSSFRSKYDYDNNLYIIAGEIVKRVSGMPWEEFVERRIMRPLAMNNSAASLKRIGSNANVVTPYASVHNQLQEVTTAPSDVVNAAGGIYSSVNDMAKWVTMLLAQGKLGNSDQRLLSETVLDEMWTPQTITQFNKAQYNTHFAAYGLGWQLLDVAGYKQVSHTGGLLGMVSQVTLIPELNLGIVVLTNQEQGLAFSAISNTIKDGYLGVAAVDRVQQYQDVYARREAATDKEVAPVLAALDAQQKNAQASQVRLSDYTGTYRDNWFGDVIITLKDGRLNLRAQRSPELNGDLSFYKGNTFVVKWKNRSLNADAFVNFNLGTDGMPVAITMKAVSPTTDFSYDFHDLDLKLVKR